MITSAAIVKTEGATLTEQPRQCPRCDTTLLYSSYEYPSRPPVGYCVACGWETGYPVTFCKAREDEGYEDSLALTKPPVGGVTGTAAQVLLGATRHFDALAKHYLEIAGVVCRGQNRKIPYYTLDSIEALLRNIRSRTAGLAAQLGELPRVISFQLAGDLLRIKPSEAKSLCYLRGDHTEEGPRLSAAPLAIQLDGSVILGVTAESVSRYADLSWDPKRAYTKFLWRDLLSECGERDA